MLCFPTQIKVGTLYVKDHQVLRLEHRLGLMEIFFFKNVPGVLKHMQTKIYFSGGGGGDFGVFGAPHAPTRGSRGVGKQYTSSYGHDM